MIVCVLVMINYTTNWTNCQPCQSFHLSLNSSLGSDRLNDNDIRSSFDCEKYTLCRKDAGNNNITPSFGGIEYACQ